MLIKARASVLHKRDSNKGASHKKKKVPHKRIERAAKREPLREKKDSQERVVHGEENKKERTKFYRL